MYPIIASALISSAAAEAPGLQSKPAMIQLPYQSGLPYQIGLPYQSIGLPQMIVGGLSNRLMPSTVSRGK